LAGLFAFLALGGAPAVSEDITGVAARTIDGDTLYVCGDVV
jgi:hypothetical protein